jgi:hypothetical protein
MVQESPESRMSAKDKGEAIEHIRQMEESLLQNVYVLRKRAGY